MYSESPEIMRILIVSLKYSPVHNAHCRALGEPLRELGFDVRYLLAGALRWTVPHSQLEHTAFIGSSRNAGEVLWDTLALTTWRQPKLRQLLQEFRPCLLLFESSHPGNVLFASVARSILPDIRCWMLVHEPYVPDKSKHGGMRSLLIAAQELALRATLRFVDGVLVPSDEALLQMKAAYPDFTGTVLKVPLLFEDRSKAEDSERRYFSFIGHAVPAKGIDTFFWMVEASASRGAEWMFQIATSTNISAYVARLSKNAQALLRAVSKPRVPDAEIDEAIRTSWAVVAPYRRVTQSGVVPAAFMHGTPVISTRVGGMPESVIPGKTGYLIDRETSFAEWEEAFRMVQANFSDLSANCRRFFLDHFDARRGPEFLRPMLDSVRVGR